MKVSEDRKEKRKEGVYDVSWQDETTVGSGPFAKVDKAAKELSSSTATSLGSLERVESLGRQELMEKKLCTETQLLHKQVESLRQESENRAKVRKEVLQLLTTAAEELDALPEELISQTNKILHSTDEADICTANLVTTHVANPNTAQDRDRFPFSPSRVYFPRSHHFMLSSNEKMGIHPIDAQRLPVSVGSLRKKLGEISLTTLLRLRNTSNEPLRLKSGVQLKEGRYIKSINASDPHGIPHCFHLYPGTEIPPKTEALVAARSGGGWFPTSGVAGKILYTNYDESWTFEVSFRNDLIGNVRRCRVKAYPTNGGDEDLPRSREEYKQYWKISKNEYDGKANNEIVISVDVFRGGDATRASFRQRPLKSGSVFKKRHNKLGSHWGKRLCVITPVEITFSQDETSYKQEKIPLRYVTKVQEDSDFFSKNVFKIDTTPAGNGPHWISTESSEERDDWMKYILEAVGLSSNAMSESSSHSSSLLNKHSSVASFVGRFSDASLFPSQSYIEDGVECVHQNRATEVVTV
mmetsp:Transcript_17645/g.40639  ORF Transcript_17645/g.40639 Transcript_17645/m.40639 type:complete len:524 (-) Transcript_17645:252-1823(-)